AADADPVAALLQELERAVRSGTAAAYLALLTDSADRTRATAFTEVEVFPGATRAVVQERDRQPLAGSPAGTGYRLLVDVFIEFGARGRVATWRLDAQQSNSRWRIADQQRISSVESLYRLAINPSKQFDASDFTLSAEDLDLTLADGSVFVIDTDQGVTG